MTQTTKKKERLDQTPDKEDPMTELMDKGAFLLTIDTELGKDPEKAKKSLEASINLLALMEQYNIKATWVIVGHMFLDHPTVAESTPYDREIVQRILSCKVPQEIGCHTFSHIRATDCSREQFEAELRACQQASRELGITQRSFVFPWNSVAHVESLRDCGFIAYRGRSHAWSDTLPVFPAKLFRLLSHWLLLRIPLPRPSYESGVWNLPDSYLFFSGSGWGEMIPISLRILKVKKGLRLAARERRLLHLWFHPFELRNNTEQKLKALESVFKEVNRYRQRGLLDNPTMGELAQSLEAGRTAV
jgi:peptidoglycan/xylan/chitin deacetylase (PgdA/CDA1 family)